ncbi:hypothetical protein AX774_g5506 [Zancudomyces culisetae]|uniref:Uncharacterized protein n=1 Tax=Zancudomyces culisetae TaxID=1213189 RepID=A0A1R1PJ91_ZANCU|nr:hypothetical protein AX774_g5506 [Zancudomyces culisetae]|eukprot:OMH81040.1 hypothetical protein AX774_g5506 [Zancudomyces culisetae]
MRQINRVGLQTSLHLAYIITVHQAVEPVSQNIKSQLCQVPKPFHHRFNHIVIATHPVHHRFHNHHRINTRQFAQFSSIHLYILPRIPS